MQQTALQATESSGPVKRKIVTSRGSSAYPRKRAVTACQVCRARRTKCDNKKPACSFCESIGAQCSSDPASLSTFDPASIAIIERLDRLEQKLDLLGTTPRSVENDQQRLGSEPVHNVLDKSNVKKLLPVNLDAIWSWPVFDNLFPINSLVPDFLSPVSTSSGNRAASMSDELNPATCKQWLDAFFQHVHIKNPILEEQQTRDLVRRVCLEGVGWDAESCLALLVCANGAVIRPFSEPSLSADDLSSSVAVALFVAAQKRLGLAMFAAGLVQARCLFLVGVFLMSTLRPFDAWRMFLQSLAVCQSFDSFNQAVSLGSRQSSSTATAEESVYWSSWKSERELRWELGLPDFANPTSDPPRFFPSLSDNYEGENLRGWYFYLSEISLWRLETASRNEMQTLIENGNDEVFHALADVGADSIEQVVAWQNSLAPVVSIVDHDVLSSGDDVLKFVLRGRTTYVHEMITWPFVYAAVNESNYDSQVREWAARGLEFHLERLLINQPGFYHRHHGTWLMLRSSARSACILLAAAQAPDTRDLLPTGWQITTEAAIEMLRFWSSEVTGARDIADRLNHLLLASDGS